MKATIIPEENYLSEMQNVVEPYLAARGSEVWLSCATGGRLHCMRYDAEDAQGTVLISHGFTESAEKYLEIIYYFVREGYNVFMPEHCGHGHSYRLTQDPSLVHVDRCERYLGDLLDAAKEAQKLWPQLPLYLYGHSMGGGIAAAALAKHPDLFTRAVLSSPMICPLTGNFPWPAAKAMAYVLCRAGKAQAYVPGGHPFDANSECFEDSASTSRARFDYYQAKRIAQMHLQTSAASCGWVREAARLNSFLMRDGWKKIRTPSLLFQSEHDFFVDNKSQERFVNKVAAAGHTSMTLVRVADARHEIFNATDAVVKGYWEQVLSFFDQ